MDPRSCLVGADVDLHVAATATRQAAAPAWGAEKAHHRTMPHAITPDRHDRHCDFALLLAPLLPAVVGWAPPFHTTDLIAMP